jgi:hypothetical protein
MLIKYTNENKCFSYHLDGNHHYLPFGTGKTGTMGFDQLY